MSSNADTFWAPGVPTFNVLFGPSKPSFVAKFFLIMVICDPGSIRALTFKVLVGVTIRQIKVLGKPSFSGMYVSVARHWRPWMSPNFGLMSEIVLGAVICYSCLFEVVAFDSSGFFLWSTRQWYL